MRVSHYTSITTSFCLFLFLILTLTTPTLAQYIGTIDTVGTTWYDIQHIGTCGRMIRLDNTRNIQVCWLVVMFITIYVI